MAETETGKVVDVHQPSRLFMTMNVIEHCSTVILDKGLMLWSYSRRTGRPVRRTVIRQRPYLTGASVHALVTFYLRSIQLRLWYAKQIVRRSAAVQYSSIHSYHVTELPYPSASCRISACRTMSDAVSYSVLNSSAKTDYAARIVRSHRNKDMVLCDLR
jgi:hypothetical protein